MPFEIFVCRKVIDVKFPKISGNSHLLGNYLEIENKLKQSRWEKERLLEDMRREEVLLNQSKYNYEVKKQEFVKFLADASSYTAQVILQLDFCSCYMLEQ